MKLKDKEEEKETPKRTDNPFLRKGNKKNIEVTELKEYVLLLMKNNGHSDFIEGVQPGEFFLKNKSGNEQKSIMLTPKKLTTLNYNGQYFKGWVAHEDNVSPYPQEPLHNGEMFRKTTQKLAINYRDANEAKIMEAGTKRIIMIMVGAAALVFILYTIGKNAGWFEAKAVAQPVVETVKAGVQM